MRELLGIIALLLFAACSSPVVVQTVRSDDASLGCEALRDEFSQVERLRDAAVREKGVTGKNVLRAIFFWPAVFGTADNANEAISAADARKVRLANQMSLKGCGSENSPSLAKYVPNEPKPVDVTAAPGKVEAPLKKTKQERLDELKEIFYMKYLSRAAYIEMRDAILESPDP
jgi:hypothetical protein